MGQAASCFKGSDERGTPEQEYQVAGAQPVVKQVVVVSPAASAGTPHTPDALAIKKVPAPPDAATAEPIPADAAPEAQEEADWGGTGGVQEIFAPDGVLCDDGICCGGWNPTDRGPPMPPNEQLRKNTATALGLFGSAKCTELDVVLEALTRIFDAPYASLALYYNKCCWLNNTCNFASGRMAWRVSACPWNCLVKQPQTIVCGELLEDARFRHQPWVKSGLRCYVSAPLLASNGHRMGTICFMDTVPRKVDAGMCRVLNNFGEIAMRVLERHLSLVQRLEAAQQSAPKQLSDLMNAATKGTPLQRVNSQGLAIQGPEAGHWADNTKPGHGDAIGMGSRTNSIGTNLNRMASGLARNSAGLKRVDSSGGVGGLRHMNSSGRTDAISPADTLLQAAFARQLRHPEVLQDACVLVVDTAKPGWPIMFADETWRLWAGFPRAEILGRNLCDILQSSAPGVAPLNWEALQAQADAHERFVLPGMVAVHPIGASTTFTTEQPSHCYISSQKFATQHDGPQDLDMSSLESKAQPAPHGESAQHAGAQKAAGATSAPLAAAPSTGASQEFPLHAERSAASTTASVHRAADAPSAEDMMEHINILEKARREQQEQKRIAEAEAGGVHLGHEALGTFLLSGQDNPNSQSQILVPQIAGNSPQNSAILAQNQGSVSMNGDPSHGIPASRAFSANGSVTAGHAPGSGRPFDLSFRPCALDVLDEDTLPLGMPSWVPLEVCEPVLRLYVVRLHERLSAPPPPQPLTPSLKLASLYGSTLAQLGGYLFPGLSIGQVLGRGGYGTAHLGHWHDVNVVVKVEDHELADLAALRQAQLEISLGQMFRHPNLVRTLGHGAVELPPPPKPEKLRPSKSPQDSTRATPNMPGSATAVRQPDIVIDSAAFDFFGGQISKWLAATERPGDFMGDDKWLSHCDEEELFRRDLFSRTTTFMELPDPSLMINASSIARDAQVLMPGTEAAEHAGQAAAFGGGNSRPLINEVRGGPSPFMEAIQEEGVVSGTMTQPSGGFAQSSGNLSKAVHDLKDMTGSFTTCQKGQAGSESPAVQGSAATPPATAASPAAPHGVGAVPDPRVPSPAAGTDTVPVAPSDGGVLLQDMGIQYTQPPLQPAVVITTAATKGTQPPTCTITSAVSSSQMSNGSSQSSNGSAPHALLPPAPTSAPPPAVPEAAPVVVTRPACTSAPLENTHTSNSSDVLTSGRFAGQAPAGLVVPSLSTDNAASLAIQPQFDSATSENGKPNCHNSNSSWLHSTRGHKSGNMAAASEEVAALLKSAEVHAERTHAKPMTFPLHLRTFAILEYCDGGTLQDAIDRGWIKRLHCSSSCPPDIPKLLQLAHDIAQGVSYLHARGVVHADLSACNILLCKISPKARHGAPAKLVVGNTSSAQQQPEESSAAGNASGLYRLPIRQYSLAPERPRLATEMQFIAKVSDFGKACLLGPEGMIRAGSYATITHCAPEVLQDRLLTPAADVYALGVLMWQMYTASRPYPSLSHAQIMAIVMHGTLALEWTEPSQLGIRPYFKDAAEKLVALGKRCLSFNMHERPSMDEVEEQLADLLQNVAVCAEVATKEEDEELARTNALEVEPEKLDLVAAGEKPAIVGC